jgi:hypothetical protein
LNLRSWWGPISRHSVRQPTRPRAASSLIGGRSTPARGPCRKHRSTFRFSERLARALQAQRAALVAIDPADVFAHDDSDPGEPAEGSMDGKSVRRTRGHCIERVSQSWVLFAGCCLVANPVDGERWTRPAGRAQSAGLPNPPGVELREQSRVGTSKRRRVERPGGRLAEPALGFEREASRWSRAAHTQAAVPP